MATSLSREEFAGNLRDSGLYSAEEFDAILEALPPPPAHDGAELAQRLVAAGKLTSYQAEAVRERRFAELVIGNYQVLGRLGAGGMGTVYKARHRRMKRVVAIKVLSKSIGQSPQFVQRFQREVEAVSRLNHPNIVMAHDADEAEAGHFLVMEFVNGRDLDSEVRKSGPLRIDEAVDAILQAARALAYAHEQGIIHRDIKPANLLRDESGVVKVADLGLARFSDALAPAPEETSALTQAGAIMGTVDYMPPEQALGLSNVDHRADIYSLGCAFHFLLTGQPPYNGATIMAILLKHRESEIPSLQAARGDAPATLDAAFKKMMAKRPEDRFGSMAEVASAFEGLSSAGKRTPVQQEVKSVSQPSAAAAVGAKGATVLLVEPSRSQAVIFRGFLQKLGFADVFTASSGEQALEQARRAPPHVVISALHLPDMTGVRMAHNMQAEAVLSATRFVIITSQSDTQVADLLCGTPNAIHLTKPFDVEQLSRALATASSDASTRVLPALDSLRVLVVDDSASARSHIRRVLSDLGVRIFAEATDGAEAVTMLEQQAYDLVVTDYNMPRLDGRGLIDSIRRQGSNPSVPIIMVTTEQDPAKLNAVRQLGVLAILDKSFKPEAVLAALERLG